MIYFTNVMNTDSRYMLMLLEDEDENWLDCWVFDTDRKLSFKGHIDSELFNFLMKDGLLNQRESVFAAAQYGEKDKPDA